MSVTQGFLAGLISISIAAAARMCGIQVGEQGVITEEGDVNRKCWTVALFRDDDLGFALELFVVAIVVLLAMDEGHHVGILLNGARLAQVREQRLFVAGALFAAAGEL